MGTRILPREPPQKPPPATQNRERQNYTTFAGIKRTTDYADGTDFLRDHEFIELNELFNAERWRITRINLTTTNLSN